MTTLADGNATGSFWDHLDELRGCIIRMLAVTGVAAAVAFCMKDSLFAVVLAPRSSDFVTFRIMGTEYFCVSLMNTGLTEQFTVHLRVALYAGVLAASPYLLYVLFRFVSPALYSSERRYAVAIVGSGYVMFVLGTLLNYFLIFPLTVRFLGTYQVSPDVSNMLTLSSYTDTLVMMSIMMGIVFEMPVVSCLLARMGLINGSLMRRYRRHAIVAILVAAAVVTPTADAFTMLLVAAPVWLLYEVSAVLAVRIREAKGHE